ncbi:MAG TPA: TMEM175 family protein [Vicinamibacterales bacterium]|nr:TMEM175 family protein [Vicinamibacterales bacterium]
MPKSRLEAFSDGVIAIIITIMVLELRTPHGAAWSDLRPIFPVLVTYVLSFVVMGIYWNNHHHMLHAAERVNGPILWANNHLLFWLSLIPFVTRWLGEHYTSPLPTAAYGVVLVMSAISYTLLQRAILAHHGPHSRLAKAVGSDGKGKLSMLLYVTAIPMAFVSPWIADAIFVFVACLWLAPDTRIERHVHE